MKYRFESFGGIVASERPPFLAYVDRQFMRELGFADSPLWLGDEDAKALLSAPTEVHFAVTNSCPNRCEHCYMGGGEHDSGELDGPSLKRAFKELADWGVFHAALGGGEALAREDIFEIAGYAREVGRVPNLTVSGALLTPKLASRMRVFGQVNVSVDGVGELYGLLRGANLFEMADRAIELLTSADVPTGINCVVARGNFGGIADVFAYAERKGVNEIEFLRLKPSGRAAAIYEKERTTYSQNVALVPRLAELSSRHGIRAKIDCSFVPMLCYHNPPRDVLEANSTYGCEAGNVLLGIRSDGSAAGCSFLPTSGLSVDQLRNSWKEDAHLQSLRTWVDRAVEPCRSCSYLDICKGGCRAVAAHVEGDAEAPDPDCPRVVEHEGRAG